MKRKNRIEHFLKPRVAAIDTPNKIKRAFKERIGLRHMVRIISI